MILRNHSNILIYCLRNIIDYCQFENSCAAQYFCENHDTFYISGLFNDIMFKRTAFI